MKLTKLFPYVGSPEGKQSNNKGFTILFAILAANALLIMALGIANITYKEVILSGSAREADHALYAADSGAECALYWIDTLVVGSTTTPSCDSTTTGGVLVRNFVSTGPITFNFLVDTNSTAPPRCAEVSVTPEFIIGADTFTRIISTGYNVDCSDKGNKRAVSRVIEVLL